MNWRNPQDVAAVEESARSVYAKSLEPIATRFEFEPPPSASETTGLPLVLLLGNHSSGKSSFVNYLVGETLQRTGIAPVDDSFTIITHGGERIDRDGQAVVTNPTLAWGDLERFGPTLLSHLRLKQRPVPDLEGLALVDSPGMIDAASSKEDRGYDFAGVVRWFAERADVILFMFDPDKPGTTGETIRILTDSLAGLDHKLLLIFNKADRFATMRDFARAYGALCWNLSKAIPRKDLPHVYTTFLPTEHGGDGVATVSNVPLDDFERSRDEVREEVRRAPFRRLDNVISRLYQYTRRLRVHARVLDQLSRERLQHRLGYLAIGTLILVGTALLLGAEWRFVGEGESRWSWIGATLLLGVGALGATFGVYRWDRALRGKNLSLDALFERTYARELTLGDQTDDLRALWASVRDRVRRALEAQGNFPRLRRGDLKAMARVVADEVPRLRAQVSLNGEQARDPALAPRAALPPPRPEPAAPPAAEPAAPAADAKAAPAAEAEAVAADDPERTAPADDAEPPTAAPDAQPTAQADPA